MSDLPGYIPAKAPAETIVDLSGKLSAADLKSLNAMGKGLNYKARVVIMPGNYQAGDSEELHSLAKSIAREWKVADDRLLMVVDLKGKKIRTIAGDKLHDSGVTNEYLQRTVLTNYFYPYVRQNDVAGAIRNSLEAINARTIAFQSTSGTAGATATTGSTTQRAQTTGNLSVQPTNPNLAGGNLSAPDGGPQAFLGIGALVVFLTVATFLIVNKMKESKAKKLYQAFTDRLGTLYAAANDLGQASDYLPPQSNKELAVEVSRFFEKLQALDKAKDEIDKLQAARRYGKAAEGLLPALKLADTLNDEAKVLSSDVNSVTGGVDSNPAPVKLAAQKGEEDAGHKIKIDVPDRQPLPYARPQWTYEQEYNQPIYINSGGPFMGGGGVFDMLFMINQMDNERRLERLEDNQRFQNYNDNNSGYSTNNSGNGNSTDSGGSWGNPFGSIFGSSSTDSGGSWDSGSSSDSSSSFDSGSFDSGSSDSGSTDSGGSW